jgi:hypothetical protein
MNEDHIDDMARAAGEALRQPPNPTQLASIYQARRRRRVLQTTAGGAAALLLVGGIWTLSTRGTSPPAVASTNPPITTTPPTVEPTPTTAGSSATTTEPQPTTSDVSATSSTTSTTPSPPNTAVVTLTSPKRALGAIEPVGPVGRGNVSWQPDGRFVVHDLEAGTVTLYTLDAQVVWQAVLPDEPNKSVSALSQMVVGPDDVLYFVYADSVTYSNEVLAMPTSGDSAGTVVARFPISDCPLGDPCFGVSSIEAGGVSIDGNIVPYVDDTGRPSGETITLPTQPTTEFTQLDTISDVPNCGTLRLTATLGERDWVIEGNPICTMTGSFGNTRSFPDGTATTLFSLSTPTSTTWVLVVARPDGSLVQYDGSQFAGASVSYVQDGYLYGTSSDGTTVSLVRQTLP